MVQVSRAVHEFSSLPFIKYILAYPPLQYTCRKSIRILIYIMLLSTFTSIHYILIGLKENRFALQMLEMFEFVSELTIYG